MAEFPINSYRFDPYKNFKFRVKWDGRYVAGISKISPLKHTIEVVPHRSGGDFSVQRPAPSTAKTEAITFERGITHDPEFENWAKLAFNVDGDTAISLKNFRKHITIELLNEQGTVAKAYHVFNCWVSEYQALPELDANAHVVAIERIVVQHEGWKRDDSVPEPTQD
jgi:phage tail-like protein|nr:phage tail protein [Kofleriaceae bacterium]